MKLLKLTFINYAPLILLLPLSLIIGLYISSNLDILLRPENLRYLYVYLLYLFAPLFFIVFRPRQDLGNEFLEIVDKFSSRFRSNFWAYLVIAMVFSAFFLYVASIHISTYLERDRWILGDLPIIPLDMVFLPRVAYILRWFFPIDISVPLANLPFILLWLAFLVYINPVEENSWSTVLLTFTSTFFTIVLYTTLYATFEFPAAAVSFIGLYGIWRKKFNIGLFFLALGSVFKNTGIFQFVPGAMLLIMHCWQEKSIRKVFEKIDIPLLVFLGAYWILNNWGLYYQIFILNKGLGYLVKPRGDEIIWLSAFLTFIKVLVDNFTILILLGLVGIILSREKIAFALAMTGLLLVARSFSRWADPEYAQIFVPSLSYAALFSLVYLRRSLKLQQAKFLLLILILGINVFNLVELFQYTPNGMNRLNSNFDQYVGKLARRLPKTGRIYEKGISILPYLYEKWDGDLEAREFRYLDARDKTEFLNEISQTGCKLIIIQKDYLTQIDATEADLISLGYSTSPYVLEDQSGVFISYSRGCNDWENN